jgi:hypothetical protein
MKTKEFVILRLLNNDRIIGELVAHHMGAIFLYAPMSISFKTEDSEDQYYALAPYDIFSDTSIAVIATDKILTVNEPNDTVMEYYEAAWPKYYPAYDDPKDKTEDSLDSKKLNEMFKSFGIDRKKLN